MSNIIRDDWSALNVLAKDLLVYEYVKDKLDRNKSYDDNWRIIMKEYERRYCDEK